MEEFSNIHELYCFLKPAFLVKERLLRKENYDYIQKEDIWNYLKETKWSNSRNLVLSEMVNDIIHVDHKLLDNYLKDKFIKRQRRIIEGDRYEYE